jgi:hypothetical protein
MDVSMDVHVNILIYLHDLDIQKQFNKQVSPGLSEYIVTATKATKDWP